MISTNSGGIPEVVEHGKSGFLSEAGNFEEMGQNALNIISDNQTHNKFKSNAIKSAKKFDIQHILPKYEEVYKESLNAFNN